MKSCTSRPCFVELLRISPLTLPSGWAATFSIVRTLPAWSCERTVCENEGFGQKQVMKPNKRKASTISARIRFVIIRYLLIWCFVRLATGLGFALIRCSPELLFTDLFFVLDDCFLSFLNPFL